MNKFLKVSFFFAVVFLPFRAGAQSTEWTFLPASTVFKPLIADPREPLTGIIAHLDQSRYEGQIGSAIELVRYTPADETQWAWGLFGAGYILLDEDGATFPMRAGDWYFGTSFSQTSGAFSNRLEFLHESGHLGDSLEGIQTPIFFSRENANFTTSFQPVDFFRLHAGVGDWLDINPLGDPFFASFGSELYSPSWSMADTFMRGYFTCFFQWKGEAGVWNKELQLGLQWKKGKNLARALRIALVYYDGDSQFGQFYRQPDEHVGLATYFDF